VVHLPVYRDHLTIHRVLKSRRIPTGWTSFFDVTANEYRILVRNFSENLYFGESKWKNICLGTIKKDLEDRVWMSEMDGTGYIMPISAFFYLTTPIFACRRISGCRRL